jgi:hypothetical protein
MPSAVSNTAMHPIAVPMAVTLVHIRYLLFVAAAGQLQKRPVALH